MLPRAAVAAAISPAALERLWRRVSNWTAGGTGVDFVKRNPTSESQSEFSLAVQCACVRANWMKAKCVSRGVAIVGSSEWWEKNGVFGKGCFGSSVMFFLWSIIVQ